MTDPLMPGVLTDLNIHNPDTIAMAEEVVQAARAAGHQLYYVWGIGGTGDHLHGIAIDFMVYDLGGGVKHPGPERPEVGNWVADYVWANRERLGVRYEIFSRRIRSRTGTPPNVWLDYHGTSDPHTNHVHVSRFPAGDSRAPSYRPPTIVKPKPPAPPVNPNAHPLYWKQLQWQIEHPDQLVYTDSVLALKEALLSMRWPALPWGLDNTPRIGKGTVAAIKWTQKYKLHDQPDTGSFPYFGPVQLKMFCELPHPSRTVRYGGAGTLNAVTEKGFKV